jgi:signal transduction histidine kinase
LLTRQAADFLERAGAEAALRGAQELLARANAGLERAVEERTAKLRETIEELEGFSYSIVHDMRAPLRAMESFAALAQEACAGCPKPEGLDYYRRMRIASNRMDQLIIDALNYSRVVREDLPLSPVDIGKLLRGMVDTYPNLQPPAVQVQLELDGLLVRGNESALTQVFGNLLGNAVKFVAPDVKPRVRVWAETAQSSESKVQSPRPGTGSDGHATGSSQIDFAGSTGPPQDSSGLARIWVEDNGIGIAPGAHKRIFEMFQRMHGVDEYPGTGIGLAIVRKAMERMGGRVGVESEPGKGSRFWIELPRGERGLLPAEAGGRLLAPGS